MARNAWTHPASRSQRTTTRRSLRGNHAHVRSAWKRGTALLSGRPRGCLGFHTRVGLWGRSPRRRMRWRRSLAASPGSAAGTLTRFPVQRWRVASRGRSWARSSPWAGVVRVARGTPAASVRGGGGGLGLCGHPPGPHRRLCQGANEPATAPYGHGLLPGSAAIPRRRAGTAASVPSACQRCRQRGALGSPPGSTGELTPAAAGAQDVEYGRDDLANGGAGLPRPRVVGSAGNRSATSSHAKSLHPSHVPAMVPT
jgi:hypothetical protein